jgi:hypothetical protein
MGVFKLTLDTNLLLEYWKDQDKRDVVETLLRLKMEGKVDLAVTSRVREDVPFPPLTNNLERLGELGIDETGAVARLGYWVLGRDFLGDEVFDGFFPTAEKLAIKHGKKPPDWRDWDHIHTHYLLKRDVFLTWDEGIVCLANEMRTRFGIEIMKPEVFLSTRS